MRTVTCVNRVNKRVKWNKINALASKIQAVETAQCVGAKLSHKSIFSDINIFFFSTCYHFKNAIHSNKT